MAILNNSFYKQVTLATIKKELNYEGVLEIEFWETEINFSHTRSDFNFSIVQPERNKIVKNYSKNSKSYTFTFEKPLERRGNVKRFFNKKDADFYILFNLMQIYKPMHNYITENDIDSKFNNLIEDFPEKFVTELSKGYKWLIN